MFLDNYSCIENAFNLLYSETTFLYFQFREHAKICSIKLSEVNKDNEIIDEDDFR